VNTGKAGGGKFKLRGEERVAGESWGKLGGGKERDRNRLGRRGTVLKGGRFFCKTTKGGRDRAAKKIPVYHWGPKTSPEKEPYNEFWHKAYSPVPLVKHHTLVHKTKVNS